MGRSGNSLSMTFCCSNEIRQGGQLSQFLYNVYLYRWPKPSPPSNMCRVLLRRCGRCLGKSPSYGDDMVLLAPTVTALQTLLEVCRAYAAAPHDSVYNTAKTVRMLARPKQAYGRYSTRVRLGNEVLRFVEEFRYLGHVMTSDCREDKDIKKQFRRENAVGNICWSGSSHLHMRKQKFNCSSQILTQFIDILFVAYLPELY